MEEERRKGKERGKVEIGKGSEVAFTDFDDFLLKPVVGARVFCYINLYFYLHI